MIPYGRQNINDDDINAVVDVLKSEFLTQGPTATIFEEEICKYTGAGYAVTSNSGTSSLHVACKALGLGVGDWLWTTPITFVASANCALYCNASVDFVDIDPVSWNMSVSRLEKKLEEAKKNNRLPKIIVAVHLCGMPCEMEKIYYLARKYGFSIIEDGCHAIGGKYKAEAIGNCRYSDITVFSFHPVKTITSGEGGMALTNDAHLAAKMRRLCSHGITRKPEEMTKKSDGPWYYQQIELGYNYRMTDIQAALGLSQLGRLTEFVSLRHQIAQRYDTLLDELPVTLPRYSEENHFSGMHLYVIRLQLEKIKKSHQQVFLDMRAGGIGVNLHYIPVHTQPWYEKMGFRQGDFPEAEQYYREAISLPMFPDLTDAQMDTVVSVLRCSLLA